MSMLKTVGRSAIWQVFGGGWITVVRLVASFFLARSLTPEDYGIFGMALLLREFVERLSSWGFGSGMIAKKDLSADDLDTCFWSVAVIRSIMFIFILFIAPLGGLFFQDNRVTSVVRIVSLTILISAIGVIPQTLLSKTFRFKELNLIKGGVAFIESILVVLVVYYTDLSYYGLAIGAVFNSLMSQISVFYLVKWKPRFKFSVESFRYLYRFGVNGLGFNLTNYLRQNIDYLVVGRLINTSALGLYEFAYRLPHLVQERISQPIGAIILPTFAKVSDNNEKLLNGYVETVKYLSVLTFPMLVGLSAIADVAVPLLWGNQWGAIVVPLRLLCLCSALRIVLQPLGGLFNCKHRPDLNFKVSLVSLLWTVMLVVFLGKGFGVNGVALAMVFSVFLEYSFLYIGMRLINGTVFHLFTQLFPVVISTTICGAISYYVTNTMVDLGFSSIVVVFSAVVFGIVSYVSVYRLLFYKFFLDIINNLKSVI